MQKNNETSEQILEVLSMLLEAEGEPTHYKMLTAALQESEAFDLNAIYKRPSDSIYGLMQADIRKGNERFGFMGGGIFVAHRVLSEAPSLSITPPPKADSKPKVVARLKVINGAAKCGDCAFISFSDLQLIGVSKLGTCGSTVSGHDYPSRLDDACECFVPKTVAQEHKERRQMINIQEMLNEYNFGIVRARKKREMANV